MDEELAISGEKEGFSVMRIFSKTVVLGRARRLSVSSSAKKNPIRQKTLIR